MRRELGQLSLADGLVEGAGRNRQLERIAALVDWPGFERQLGEIYAAPVGRPSYGPLVLLKCLDGSQTRPAAPPRAVLSNVLAVVFCSGVHARRNGWPCVRPKPATQEARTTAPPLHAQVHNDNLAIAGASGYLLRRWKTLSDAGGDPPD
jgi:hypothetical protein